MLHLPDSKVATPGAPFVGVEQAQIAPRVLGRTRFVPVQVASTIRQALNA